MKTLLLVALALGLAASASAGSNCSTTCYHMNGQQVCNTRCL